MTAIGIDFGTTNSVVAVHRPAGVEVLDIDEPPVEWAPYGFDKVFPSVIAHDPVGRLDFGWAAKMRSTGRYEAIKRMFATQLDIALDDVGGALAVEEAATMLFAEMRRRAIEKTGDTNIDTAVVTVPANSKGQARHRTKLCAGMAGMEVLALINEPTAAAMAFAQRHPHARQLMVFDWGGGTLDVSLLQSVDGVFIEQSSAGESKLGGIDFDSSLEKIVRNAVPGLENLTAEERSKFRLEIEFAKIRLSMFEEHSIQLPNGQPYRITRNQFEASVRGIVDRSREPIDVALRNANVKPSEIDALILVGGTCKIPLVRSFVRDYLKIDPETSIDPMTAIGEGAAIAAAILSGTLTDSDFFVSIEHALGTFIMDPGTKEITFSTLIPKGHKLPARVSDSFVPVFRESEQLVIEVVEGDPNRENPDFIVLKEWTVRLPETYSPDSDRGITLQYEYDVDGILRVTVNDVDTGTLLLDDDISYGVANDKRGLKQIADRSRRAVEEGELAQESIIELTDPESTALITKALSKVIPFLDADEAFPFIQLVENLQKASGPGLTTAKEELRRAMAPYSYLF